MKVKNQALNTHNYFSIFDLKLASCPPSIPAKQISQQLSKQSDSSLREATIRGLQSSGVIWSSFRSITRTLLLTVFTNEKHMSLTCNTARNTALWVCFWPQIF